jgi:hypothetical protein
MERSVPNQQQPLRNLVVLLVIEIGYSSEIQYRHRIAGQLFEALAFSRLDRTLHLDERLPASALVVVPVRLTRPR